MQFPRHRTALVRQELSRPVRTMLEAGLLPEGASLFDYGCGRGGDLRHLQQLGVSCSGWDPRHAPEAERRAADVVNLGYVVNVIEAPGERAETLQSAWSLARRLLVVSARLRGELAATKAVEDFGDGVVTQRGTFQKFFEQPELRNWINQTLGVDAVAAAPGIFFVFRNDADRASFLAARFRRAPSLPRLSRIEQLVTDHRDLFDSLTLFMASRGRPPGPEEWADYDAFLATVGSMERGVRALHRACETGSWEAVRAERTEDLILYIALARFDGRPGLHQMDSPMQRDIKAFFGSYKEACRVADDALALMGDEKTRDAAISDAKIGKCLPSALYLHESVLPHAPLTLRLYEGCARHYAGSVEGGNIVKLARKDARVSYLSYPDFEIDPHPSLAQSVSVGLQTFQIKERDYRRSANPPILHRKETFLTADHPLSTKFARLSRSEERYGLYDDTSRIGTHDGWNAVLAEKGVALKGHRIVILPGNDKTPSAGPNGASKSADVF